MATVSQILLIILQLSYHVLSVPMVTTFEEMDMTLPDESTQMVTAYDPIENMVWFFGGYGDEYIPSKHMKSLSLDSFQFNSEYPRFTDMITMKSQSFAVDSTNAAIYMLASYNNKYYIDIFDIEGRYLNQKTKSIAHDNLNNPCLLFIANPSNPNIDYLILIDQLVTIIYQIVTDTQNVASISELTNYQTNFDIQTQTDLCCHVMDQFIYVIGGSFIQKWEYNPNDMGDVGNNVQTPQILLHDEFIDLTGQRCAVKDNYIYIFGGKREFDLTARYSDSIYVLDTMDDTIRETITDLPLKMADFGVIIDNNGDIYIFGGEIGDDQVSNKWFRSVSNPIKVDVITPRLTEAPADTTVLATEVDTDLGTTDITWPYEDEDEEKDLKETTQLGEISVISIVSTEINDNSKEDVVVINGGNSHWMVFIILVCSICVCSTVIACAMKLKSKPAGGYMATDNEIDQDDVTDNEMDVVAVNESEPLNNNAIDAVGGPGAQKR